MISSTMVDKPIQIETLPHRRKSY